MTHRGGGDVAFSCFWLPTCCVLIRERLRQWALLNPFSASSLPSAIKNNGMGQTGHQSCLQPSESFRKEWVVMLLSNS